VLNFDAVLVPQGAEYQAVARACQGYPGPSIIAVPAGAALGPRLETLLSGQSWQRLLIMGLCGSLDPRFGLGSVVIYQACIGLDGQTETCDPDLRLELGRVLPNAEVLALTSARVVSLAREKRQYHAQFGAQVVDMEGQVALKVLTRHGIAVAMVRVVSDDSEHDLPDLNAAFTPQGGLQPLALAQALLKSPMAGLRLVHGSLQALRVLAQTARIILGVELSR